MEQSKLRSALSWADEVEEEEAEMARFCVQEKQKPNPFGSARPREVVLRERQLLRQSPPRPISVFRNQLKEEAISPQVFSIFHHPESAIFVPPLRYPPKNVVAAALLLNSHSLNIPREYQHQNQNIQADQAQKQLNNGIEQKSSYVGCKRKGFQRNWKNKDDDDDDRREREQRPRRLPLVEATQNRLLQNESNQNKSGFQNQKLCKDTAQWIVRGTKHPIP